MMKTVVITGVSRGLGRAMAFGFARSGCQVIGTARSKGAIESLQSELPDGQFGIVDVSDDSSVAEWAKGVIGEFGSPDLLVNNAAIINRNAKLWEISAEDFELLTAININGTANTIRHFAPSMIEKGSGVIVNFSSGWGRSVSPEVAPYCASKWAIEGMTQALAEELPKGVSAVALNPGVINTEMLQSCFGEHASAYPTAEEWAERAIPFILGLGPDDNGRPLTVG